MNYNARVRKMLKRNKKGPFAPHAIIARRFFWVSVLLLTACLLYVGVRRETPATQVQAAAEPKFTTTTAYVTGFNTVKEQTDSKPCESASGHDICGRTDVVACPRHLALGTKVEIDGKVYICLDRTAKRYNARFDISCDKDFNCPSRVTGRKIIKIY